MYQRSGHWLFPDSDGDITGPAFDAVASGTHSGDASSTVVIPPFEKRLFVLTTGSSVLLFPGQGAYDERVLPTLRERHPHVGVLFTEIDRAATRLDMEPPARHLLGDESPSIGALLADDPDLLQLAIYGTSVALAQVARAQGIHADALLGHSFGEIAALVVGEAYTVEEGAEIVVRRSALLRGIATDSGVMLAVGSDRERVERILDLVADAFTVVAVENEPRQTVVSGPRAAIDAVAAIAAAVRIATQVLSSPYPFHSPLLAPGVAELSRQLRHLPGNPLQTPVYSPMLGRYLRPDDHLGEHLARGLVRPVRFLSAVRRLHDEGARTFVECGAGRTMSHLVQRCVPGVTAVSLTDVDRAVTARPGPVGDSIVEPVAAAVAPRRAKASAPPAGGGAEGRTRADLFDELAATYAAALEYPVEVFTETVVLEADLGIDSMKQTELLARAADRYGLPDPPPDFQLGDYDTMGKVVDYLWSARDRAVTTASAAAAALRRAEASAPPAGGGAEGRTRADLFDELAATYAAALEYPVEVFTETVVLEADLGIDSMKQTELLARAADRYGLPDPPPDFQLGDYDTMGKVVDYLWSTRDRAVTTASAAAAAAAAAVGVAA